MKNFLSFWHLGAGEASEGCGVSSLPPSRAGVSSCLPGPGCSRGLAAHRSLSWEAAEKAQLLPGVEPCQGHQAVAADMLHTQFGGFLLEALHNLSLWHIFLEHFVCSPTGSAASSATTALHLPALILTWMALTTGTDGCPSPGNTNLTV